MPFLDFQEALLPPNLYSTPGVVDTFYSPPKLRILMLHGQSIQVVL
jgi:hypothetical protein